MLIPRWLVDSLKRPILFGVCASMLTAALSLLMVNQYRSEGSLLPIESKGLGGGLGNLAAAAAAFGVNVPGGDGSDAFFVEILNSRTLREKLLQTEFSFKTRSWRFGAEQIRHEQLGTYFQSKNMDQGLRKLRALLSVTRDMKSRVITVTAETESPELSRQVVRRAFELLEDFVKQKGRTRGSTRAIFAAARLAEARAEMDRVEGDLRRFLDVNRNYVASPDPAVRLKGLRLEAELRLHQQLVTTLALGREQALMDEKNDQPILNVLDGGNLPYEKSRPSRVVLVVFAFLGVAFGTAFWDNRRWILVRG